MNENKDDVQRMQREAIRRVQEMQSRAKSSLEGKHNPEPSRNGNCKNIQEKTSVPDNKESEECKSEQGSHSHVHKISHKPEIKVQQSNILDTLMKDSERNLILLLILILVGEEADSSIILALMYLML